MEKIYRQLLLGRDDLQHKYVEVSNVKEIVVITNIKMLEICVSRLKKDSKSVIRQTAWRRD